MTLEELKERQSWTLSQKIDHSLGVIDQFYNRMDGKCYVSFSGGKDSTIVLWLARKIFPDMKAAFCNTGNEYPDIVKFVRSFDNVDWITPKLKPEEVLGQYGFPLVSKEVSSLVGDIRRNPKCVRALRALDLIETKTKGFRLAEKWRYLINEPYTTDSACCRKLKKEPCHKYEKETGFRPILGVMASESNMRKLDYVMRGGV